MFLSSKMLMGIDIEGISVVVFVRVMNMMHYIVQGKSSKYQKVIFVWEDRVRCTWMLQAEHSGHY